MPYGFPSGAELKWELVERLAETRLGDLRPNLVAAYKPDPVLHFHEALSKSGMKSVDAFLEHRDEFLALGKAAIAGALLPKEDEKRLFAEHNSWYEYLFNKLTTRRADFRVNQLRIVTFNYDRTLEHYLRTALIHSYRLTPNEGQQLLEVIPIVHVYGSLGAIPVDSNDANGIPFGAPATPDVMVRSAENIRILHESEDSSPSIKAAHSLLRTAERVILLGFGYDATNLRRVLSYGPGPTQEFYGSTFDMTVKERDNLQITLMGRGISGGLRFIDRSNKDALAFLRETCPFDD